MAQSRKLTKAECQAQLRIARERTRQFDAAGLHATAAWYDPARAYIMLTLTNGRLFGVSVNDIPYLQGATPQQLAAVTVSPMGSGLSWRALDVDLSVEGLLYEAFPVGIVATLATIEVAVAAKTRSAATKRVKGRRARKRVA